MLQQQLVGCVPDRLAGVGHVVEELLLEVYQYARPGVAGRLDLRQDGQEPVGAVSGLGEGGQELAGLSVQTVQTVDKLRQTLRHGLEASLCLPSLLAAVDGD